MARPRTLAARLARGALIGAAAGFAIVSGCVLPGFDKVKVGDGGSGGKGDGCDHATPPKRPTSGDPGGSLDLVFAVRTIDFGENDPDNRPGLDLDQTCTCGASKQEGQCVIPPFVTSAMTPCDPPDGRDNAVANLIVQSKTALMKGSKEYSDAITTGQWTLVFRLTEYDGSAEDSSVRVSTYLTDKLGAPPVWDGMDAWPIRPESLAVATDLSKPLIVDPNAYVVDHTLVSIFSGQLELNGLKVRLASGFFTAQLVEDAGKWRLDEGLMAGTWQANDALNGVGSLLVGPLPLCNTGTLYEAVHNIVCNAVDIASSPSLPCDSLSFGMKLTAEAATLGPIAAAQMPGPTCPVDQCGLR